MTVQQVLQAAQDRKAIVWGHGARSPAAWIANWPLALVMRHIHTFKIYKPKKPTRRKK